jgi:hypothetical protein
VCPIPVMFGMRLQLRRSNGFRVNDYVTGQSGERL